MELVTTEYTVYKPEINLQTGKYEDNCPFEKRKAGSKMVCRCRHQDDMFNTVSQFNAHIKHQFHKDWVNTYEKYNIDEIIAELTRDKAIIYVDLEKQQNRVERYKRKNKELLQRINELENELGFVKNKNKEMIEAWSAIEIQISNVQKLY